MVVLDGQILPRARRLDVDYELRKASLGLSGGRHAEDVHAYGTAGLGWHELEVELTSPTQRAQTSERWVGVLVALGFLWTPLDGVGLETRGEFIPDLSSQASQLELGVVLAPRSPVALALAWRWLGEFVAHESQSDLDLRLDGPFLSMRVQF